MADQALSTSSLKFLAEHPAPWRLVPRPFLGSRVDDARGDVICELRQGQERVAVLLVDVINRLAAIGPFAENASLIAADARERFPFRSIQETPHKLASGMKKLCTSLQKPSEEQLWSEVYEALLPIAATAIQAAKTYGIETRSDALDREIPF